MRDLDAKPYTDDEQRVGKYIDFLTGSSIGWGDDPIGFLIASHSEVRRQRDELAAKVKKLAKS